MLDAPAAPARSMICEGMLGREHSKWGRTIAMYQLQPSGKDEIRDGP